MIPLLLQEDLKIRLLQEFNHFKLKNLTNDYAPIKIFEQHLPNKGKEKEDPYPCIIIRLADGSKTDPEEGNKTKVQFIIGVVDRNSNNQGYKDAVNVANRITDNLERNPLINDQYELGLPINWAYHDEDAEPYFFVGIETNWKTPQILREDVGDLI
ncbi:hypothetical protein [Lentibacillus sp. Marseille-P4043]|uniref:hypothetical protein n=1 Tax=Lentibacillus sp. Marseille-P4043 TaxID=2040293 RepID=UPI000D0B9F95|nr:hypothetical protein [Lentibacillus sp. Marseille-P4043]